MYEVNFMQFLLLLNRYLIALGGLESSVVILLPGIFNINLPYALITTFKEFKENYPLKTSHIIKIFELFNPLNS